MKRGAGHGKQVAQAWRQFSKRAVQPPTLLQTTDLTMSYRMFVVIAAALALALPSAAEGRVRQMRVIPLAVPGQPHGPAEPIPAPRHRGVQADTVDPNLAEGPSTLLVYPVAGEVSLDGGDLSIPYYADLDPSGVRRDFDCTDLTFNGHEGHDPYIRSFREQAIGVPVFAVLDGQVIEIRDGEPDENTDNNPARRANFITLRHANDMTTQYVHLRRGSIPFQVGDRVSAGTQIGLVGSSGTSTAPHVHFEVRYNGEPFEPMAGPCRPGKSFFDSPVPPKSAEFALVGATLSTTSFDNVRPAPYDDAPHTGTFTRGQQTIYFKADVANVGATTTYELQLQGPGGGAPVSVANGRLISYDASLAAVWWALDVDLNATGTWTLRLNVDDKHIFSRPFTVVNTFAEIVNRPPSPFTTAIHPLRSGDVPVCRVSGDPLADPDYNVVAYRYLWQVDGVTVRDATTAARTDAIARNLVRAGNTVSCAVTASDGTLSTQAATAFADVNAVRRRAVRSR
jgi:hypothetical protein